MNPNREEALFQMALGKPAEKRADFLDSACHGDPALRARLEALLAAHEGATKGPGNVLGNEPAREALAPTLDPPEPVADEAVGMTLGRYKLREKLGEGGCGTVYVAEQTEPVRRRVSATSWFGSATRKPSRSSAPVPRRHLHPAMNPNREMKRICQSHGSVDWLDD